MASTTLEFAIADQHVTCRFVSPDRREWHCDCAEFARRAGLYREGFCAHMVCAIQQAVQDGQIDVSPIPLFSPDD